MGKDLNSSEWYLIILGGHKKGTPERKDPTTCEGRIHGGGHQWGSHEELTRYAFYFIQIISNNLTTFIMQAPLAKAIAKNSEAVNNKTSEAKQPSVADDSVESYGKF